MTFKELLLMVDEDYLMQKMAEIFYDNNIEDRNIQCYRKVFNELINTTAIEQPKWKICMDYVQPGQDYEGYFDVYGKNGTLQKETDDFKYFSANDTENFADSEVKYALDFTPWNEVLGMNIDDELLDKYHIEEIIVQILWEITFISYNQNEIASEMNELQKRVESVKNGTAELISLDDVLKKLKDKIE